ncbi:hypothetical protein [Nostoc sp.]|uniref:hypothetical protein n=1 Tax=Nostoc sp. TaxID=1180 RepID=UPI002FF7377B
MQPAEGIAPFCLTSPNRVAPLQMFANKKLRSLRYSALLNHGMISPDVERIINRPLAKVPDA